MADVPRPRRFYRLGGPVHGSENPRVQVFLEEFEALCKKHKLMVSVQDYGTLVVEPYTSDDFERYVWGADDNSVE